MMGLEMTAIGKCEHLRYGLHNPEDTGAGYWDAAAPHIQATKPNENHRRNQLVIKKTLSNLRKLKKHHQIQKLSYIWHLDEHKQRAAVQRLRHVERLKRDYQISISGMDQSLADEVITKMREMELGSLALEQDTLKTTRRVQKIQLMPKTKRNRPASIKPAVLVGIKTTETKKKLTGLELPLNSNLSMSGMRQQGGKVKKTSHRVQVSSNGNRLTSYDEPTLRLPHPQHTLLRNRRPHEEIQKTLEDGLSCTPAVVIFQDYKQDETYSQKIVVQNTSSEPIYYRSKGVTIAIPIEDRGSHDFLQLLQANASGVIWPGLSMTWTVTLDTTKQYKGEITAAVLLETRRKENDVETRKFQIPIHCTPPRAIVTVLPTQIRFPWMTWQQAAAPENLPLLRRRLRISNSGGLPCSFTITKCCKDTQLGPLDTLDANSILEELMDNIFDAFQFDNKYNVQVPAFASKELIVTFNPQYTGLHYDVYYVRFEGCHNLQEVKVHLCGDIKKSSLQVDTTIIDLKTCVLDSCACQATFQVRNEGSAVRAVVVTVPKAIRSHARIYPPEAVIPHHQAFTFIIKFCPRRGIRHDAKGYFDSDTHCLEFPISIHPKTPNGWPEHIEIYVFAILTDYALDLQPKEINFGRVTTTATIRSKLTIANHSLATQEFGFLDLQEGIEIHPNCGFGHILPCETISLDLLYTPRPRPWYTGSSAMEENKTFQIKVTTIHEQGRYREAMPTNHKTDITATDNEHSRDLNDSGNQTKEQDRIVLESASLSREGNQSQHYAAADNEETPSKKNLSTLKELHNVSNVVICRAHVMTSLCQLSANLIQTAATPYTSFSMTKFHLQGYNELLSCPCHSGSPHGTGHRERPQFEARFEFFYDSDQFELEPASGHFEAGEVIPITAIYRPRLPAVEQSKPQAEADNLVEPPQEDPEAKEPQSVGRIRQIHNKNPKSRRTNKGKRSSQEQEKVAEREEEEETEQVIGTEDILQEYENMGTAVAECKVQCLIRTRSKDSGEARCEVHDLLLRGPVIEPAFVCIDGSQNLEFGKVVLGTRLRKRVVIRNNMDDTIRPCLSILNPAGPFYPTPICRTVRLDPQQVWEQPITFAPFQEGMVNEYFEMSYGSTILRMTARGEGVAAQFKIIPEMFIQKMETGQGNTINITNMCAASLRIHVARVCEKQIEEETSQNKGRGMNFAPETPEEVLKELETYADTERPVFEMLGLDADSATIVPALSTETITIRFTAPTYRKKSSGQKLKSSQISADNLVSSESDGPTKQSTLSIKKYAALFYLLLGETVIKEYLFLGTIKPRKKQKIAK